MALPVQQFQLLTPDQISPMMTGMSQANQLYQQNVQNKYLAPTLQQNLIKAQLANQIAQAQANVAPKMSAAQLAYQQAKTPNLNAATQYILGGQLPSSQAQAAYIGTEAAKNNFSLQNPTTMLPGMAGQLGSLAILRNLLAAKSIANANPPVNNNVQSSGSIPGMPSAGGFQSGSNGVSNENLLPQSPYLNSSFSGSQLNSIPIQADGLPSTPDLMKLGVNSILAPMQKNISQADWYNAQVNALPYRNLPPEEKSYAIAQVAGMGVDPSQASALLNSGHSISSIAQSLGLDPNNLPTPIYAASNGTVQLIQRRNQAIKEINTIQPQITSAMAPYSRRFSDYSPSQIADAIKGDDPDQQARFLAARALNPEMASLRLKAMGGNIGIEAIKEVNNQSMGNIKSFQGLVSPKVYTSAQNYVDQWINQGANAANSIGLAGSLGNLNNGGKPILNSTMSTASSSPSMISMKAPNGELFRIPSSNLQAALKMGAIQQ
ncbi:MAG: hypothetical protein ACTHME_05020 [Candidatus Nitrosocosmicus sp.]